jgi:Tfp pilus assembly protein PilV
MLERFAICRRFHRPLAAAGRANRDTRRARGFTAIETLISMTIMVVGAIGVISMQKTSVQANFDARNADVASSIARTWVERIRHESMRWTQPSASSTASNLTNVTGLNSHIGNGWFRPTDDMIAHQSPAGTVETMSYAFDVLGRDLALADIAPSNAPPNVHFCVEARITSLVANSIYRVDVRVIWPRGIQSVPNANTGTPLAAWPCSSSNTTLFSDPLDYTIYHAVNVTTAIAENAAP